MKWTSTNAIQIRAKTMPPVWIKSEDSRVYVCQVRGVSDKDGASSKGGKKKSAGAVQERLPALLRWNTKLQWGEAK